jgi:hypothetical protein
VPRQMLFDVRLEASLLVRLAIEVVEVGLVVWLNRRAPEKKADLKHISKVIAQQDKERPTWRHDLLTSQSISIFSESLYLSWRKCW